MGTPYNARISALGGAATWFVFLFLRTAESSETELIQKILLLGILVIVPLGLSLIPYATIEGDSILRATIAAQPVAAVATAFAFLLNPGGPSAILTASWLLLSAAIGLCGVVRLLRRGPILSREICIDVGMIYLPVGAAWLMASRLGIQPLGFGDTIVLLTAMHFHFAGFAAPVLAGLAGRVLPTSQPLSRTFALSGLFIIAGTPFVAAGITFSPALALVGAVIISVGLILLAILVLGWILRLISSFLAQSLLVVSSLSSVFAMILACLFAYSLVVKSVIVDIPQMAMTHGILNSFGFSLCGLIAWTIASPKVQLRKPETEF
jgi:hypothetical protein